MNSFVPFAAILFVFPSWNDHKCLSVQPPRICPGFFCYANWTGVGNLSQITNVTRCFKFPLPPISDVPHMSASFLVGSGQKRSGLLGLTTCFPTAYSFICEIFCFLVPNERVSNARYILVVAWQMRRVVLCPHSLITSLIICMSELLSNSFVTVVYLPSSFALR